MLIKTGFRDYLIAHPETQEWLNRNLKRYKEDDIGLWAVTQLMGYSESYYSDKNIGGFQLFTGSENISAQRFYESLGYSRTDEIMFDENLNPCDFNEKVANAYTDTVLQSIELAKQLRIPVLNMHLSKGVYFTLPEKKVYLFDEYMDVYLVDLIHI